MPNRPFGEPLPFLPEPAESAPVIQCHQVIHETQLAITRYLQDLQARSAQPLNRDLANQQVSDVSARIGDNVSQAESLAWEENGTLGQKVKKDSSLTQAQVDANLRTLTEPGLADRDMAAYALKRDFLDLEAQRANLDREQQNIETDVGEAKTLLARNEPAYGVAMMRLSTLDSVVPYYQEVNRTVQDLEQELARRRRVLSGEDLSLQDPEGRVNNAVGQIRKIDDALPGFTLKLEGLNAPLAPGVELDVLQAAQRAGEREALSGMIASLRESRERFAEEYRQRAAEVMVGPASIEATEEELRAARGKLPQSLAEEEGANTHVGGLTNEAIRNVYATLDAANTTTEVVGLRVVDLIVALLLKAKHLHSPGPLSIVRGQMDNLMATVPEHNLEQVQALITAKLQAQAVQT